MVACSDPLLVAFSARVAVAFRVSMVVYFATVPFAKVVVRISVVTTFPPLADVEVALRVEVLLVRVLLLRVVVLPATSVCAVTKAEDELFVVDFCKLGSGLVVMGFGVLEEDGVQVDEGLQVDDGLQVDEGVHEGVH